MSAFCFAENTIFTHEYFIANFVITINTCLVFKSCVAIGLALPIIPYFVPASYERYVKGMSLPKIAAQGEAFSTV